MLELGYASISATGHTTGTALGQCAACSLSATTTVFATGPITLSACLKCLAIKATRTITHAAVIEPMVIKKPVVAAPVINWGEDNDWGSTGDFTLGAIQPAIAALSLDDLMALRQEQLSTPPSDKKKKRKKKAVLVAGTGYICFEPGVKKKDNADDSYERQLAEQYMVDNPDFDDSIVDSKTGEWAGEVYEVPDDSVEQKFMKAVGIDPELCVRYEFDGSPLWYRSHSSPIPDCERCDGPRVYEFQVMPHLLSLLPKVVFETVEESRKAIVDGLDWATVVVFVCEDYCSPSDSDLVDEFCVVQQH